MSHNSSSSDGTQSKVPLRSPPFLTCLMKEEYTSFKTPSCSGPKYFSNSLFYLFIRTFLMDLGSGQTWITLFLTSFSFCILKKKSCTNPGSPLKGIQPWPCRRGGLRSSACSSFLLLPIYPELLGTRQSYSSGLSIGKDKSSSKRRNPFWQHLVSSSQIPLEKTIMTNLWWQVYEVQNKWRAQQDDSASKGTSRCQAQWHEFRP